MPLAVLILVPLLGMLALSVDLGWITATQSELQNAADSAALAAAGQMIDGYTLYNLPTQANKAAILATAEQNAVTYAQQFASYNGAGDVSSLALNAGDVTFGFTNSSGAFTPAPTFTGYPNTVKVTVRRDSSANGPLGLFFAAAIGTANISLTATASATVYASSANNGFTGFNSSAPGNGSFMPLVLDDNVWNTFLATGVSSDGTVHAGPNGSPQLNVYPNPGNAPGNFGLLNIGPPISNAPDFSTWIRNGPTSSDLAYLTNNNLVPVSVANPKLWEGGPGLKSTLVDDFQSIMNTPRSIVLFTPVSTSPYIAASGQGSNTFYKIVGFAGVTVTQATGHGSNMDISIQPTSVFDATMNYTSTSIGPAGSQSTLNTTFIEPKLTY